MSSELNKLTLNNEIVLMRHDIRKARVHLVHKITRTIKTLRSGKGSKEPAEKDLIKADKLVEEIRTLKALEEDYITKILLVYVDDPEKVLSDVRKTLQERVLAKMFTSKIMEISISKFRRKYPNWLEDVPALLKNMKKKKKKSKPKNVDVNGKDKVEHTEKPTDLPKNTKLKESKPKNLKVLNAQDNIERGTWKVTKSDDKTHVKTTVISSTNSWSVTGIVENAGPGNGLICKSKKISKNTENKSPIVGKVEKSKKKFSESEESEGGSSTIKRSRLISLSGEEGLRQSNKNTYSKDEENRFKSEKKVDKNMLKEENEEKFESRKNKKTDKAMIKEEVVENEEKFESRKNKKTDKAMIKEEIVENGEKFKSKKNADKRTGRTEGIVEDQLLSIKEDENDLEERFKMGKKVGSEKKNGKEMKVVDPFFMTNDDSEYLTVVSSKEQAEALQNPSKSSNYRNDDEELYYGSSLTGGFRQISHHEKRKSSFTNLNSSDRRFGGSDRRKGNFGSFSKGGGGNDGFQNREFGSHALPRRERRKLMNADTKETSKIEDEKLHPSWEAKRRQSCPAIPQFTGKKIVFDD